METKLCWSLKVLGDSETDVIVVHYFLAQNYSTEVFVFGCTDNI